MAHQIHPDSSLLPLLKRITAEDILVCLFTNDIDPDRDTVLADLTEMVGGTGYARIPVAAADFVLEGVVAHAGVLMAPPVTFTVADVGGLDICGYYYLDAGGTILLAVCRFDAAPIDLGVTNTFDVWPVFGDNSVFSS